MNKDIIQTIDNILKENQNIKKKKESKADKIFKEIRIIEMFICNNTNKNKLKRLIKKRQELIKEFNKTKAKELLK